MKRLNRKPADVDWERMKGEYESGKYSVPALCSRYSVPYEQVIIEINRSDWRVKQQATYQEVAADAVNDQERVFIEEYLSSFDPVKAASRAGYDWPKFRSAILLSTPHIREEIDGQVKRRMDRLAVTKDRVLMELARVAFVSMADFIKIEDGKPVLDLSKAEASDSMPALSEVTMREDSFETKAGARTTRSVKVKISGKMEALQLLAQHLGVKGANRNDGSSDFKSEGLSELVSWLSDVIRQGQTGQNAKLVSGGPVLPAQVRSESKGRGEGMVIPEDTRGPSEAEQLLGLVGS